ncbi:glutathione S-transferase [Alphaproteobacteria bacterium 46_93_T64]|nr:glutathione S-transferase [Alphaproteobacteria bacterium 46_93_T64]
MLKLHHAKGSRSARIIWLLEELGLEYEINELEFHPRALKTDEHKKRHPLGRVPVLQDGDVTLFESGAIIQYILARYADGNLYPATDDPAFPAYLQWFHYVEGTLMPPIGTIVTQTVLLPPERRNADVLAMAERLASKVLGPINTVLIDNEYLIGDFSAADVMLGHAVAMCANLQLVNDGHPNLQAYVERIKLRPAFAKAMSL